MKFIYSYILLCFFPTILIAQDYFTVDRHRNVQILESYDGGYLLLAHGKLTGDPTNLTKLNLTGDILWEISMEEGYALLTSSMEIDVENNIYIAGNSGRHDDTYGNSFTLKLSPCGEVIWIHFYGYDGYWDIVTDLNISQDQFLYSIYNQSYGIRDEPGGSIVNPGKLRYAKMNLDGDTIWSGIWPFVTGVDEHNEVIATSDGGVLISMEDYYTYEGSPNYLRPTYMKVDPNGEVDWIERLDVENGILGHGYSAVELSNGNFACALIQRPLEVNNYFPLYFATLNAEGELIEMHQLSEDLISSNGGVRMLQRNENELILTAAPAELDEVYNSDFQLYKLDIEGNILETYLSDQPYIPTKSIDICENGDILIAVDKSGADEPNNIHIYRFDGETLEPIPVPTEDNNDYDTLCPDGIAMSEYSFPTVEDLGQAQLTITNGMAFQSFPNPVKDKLSLQWTKPLEQTNESWLVECYDVFGKLIYQTDINSSSRSIALNTSAWKKGVYFLSIKQNNKLIYQNKIVK